MKVLIDTNVIFDVYQHRQPHYSASNQVLKLARRGELCGAVASHTIANGFYFYRSPFKKFLRERLIEDIEVCCADAHLTRWCIDLGFSDLEDALQAGAAMAWKAQFIITRNVRDFRKSKIPAMAPSQFLNRFFRSEL
jgi:predicted nucleic acid-binding protein